MRKHRFQGITTDYAHRYGTDAVAFIRTCFYVDDGLCSVDNENRALNLIQRSIAMCKEGGVELAKFVSSSSHVTKNLVSRDHSLVWSKINIDFLAPVNESSLGVNWNVNDDSFFYSTQTPPEIYTRRKVLSVIASVFDSMGLVSLFFSSENKFFNKHVFVGSTGMTLCQITFKSSTKTGVLSSKNSLQS